MLILTQTRKLDKISAVLSPLVKTYYVYKKKSIDVLKYKGLNFTM